MDKTAWKTTWRAEAGRRLRPVTAMVFTLDLCLIGASWMLWTRGGHFGLLAWPILLLAMIHCYLIVHEAAHKLVSRRRPLNDAVGHFCGWFIALPFMPRQRNHLGHHAWAGHPIHDPENGKLIQKFAVITDQEVKKLERVWRSWFPLIAVNHIKDTWKDPFARLQAGSKSHPRSRYQAEATWGIAYVLVYVSIASALALHHLLLTAALWYFVPWFFFLMFIEFANLPHHAETPLQREEDPAIPMWAQDEVSHNCATVPLWSWVVMLNFNLHIVHHQFPNVPWYRLRELDRQFSAREPRSSELGWALRNRRRPLLQIMGHYFDKRGSHGA